jgi:glutamine cyclotransferase
MTNKSLLTIKRYGFIIPVLFLFFQSCKGEGENEGGGEIIYPEHHQVPARIVSPANGDQFDFGDEITVEIEVKEPEKVKDMKLLVNGEVFADDLKAESQNITFKTDIGRVGEMKFFLSYVGDDGQEHGDNREVVIFSDLVPALKTVNIVEELPHNRDSYTQGLEFYQGKLFEGTGQWGLSHLQEVGVNNGEILRQYAIPNNQFGEGITILNDTIYQLTYKASTCYYYDMDFNLLGQFNYEGEGWGLCNDGKSLIMSNGSHILSWRNPKTFAVEKTLEVYDDQRGMINLNELEVVNGNLLANVYTEKYIVEIDTLSGKVLTKIDCSDLVRKKPLGSDVLNGIALNPQNNKLYLTGKLWDKLYQVTIE